VGFEKDSIYAIRITNLVSPAGEVEIVPNFYFYEGEL
jgi:hypothetical protein